MTGQGVHLPSDSNPKHRPERTCVGCRGKGDKSALVRIVVQHHESTAVLIVDERGSMPGRGAHVHPGCVSQALRRKAFTRALRITGTVDTSHVQMLESSPLVR